MKLQLSLAAACASLALTAVCLPAQAATSTDPVARLLASSRSALGADALKHVRILKLIGKATVGGVTGTGTSWQEMGGKRLSETVTSPSYVGGDGYDGTVVWNSDATGLVWVDGGTSGRTAEIAQAFNSNYALWAPDRGGAAVTWGGSKTNAGHSYDVLIVKAPQAALPFELWFDPKTHLPARFVLTVGPNTTTQTYGSYRAVAGLMIAYAARTEGSDGNVTEVAVTSAVVNPPDGPVKLERPKVALHDFSIAGGALQTSVPTELIDNHVFLDVMLNGKGPYRFIFDTGGANIVDPAVAKEIGAIGNGTLQGGGAGSGTEGISFANVDTMQIGAATIAKQPFFIAPTRAGFGIASGRPVDGLIGFEVLSRFVTTFDYAGKRVVLQMPGANPPAGSKVIPFFLNSRQPAYACAIDGISGQCAIDTGARDSITLMTPFVAAHPQVMPQKLTADGVTGYGFGGGSIGKLGRLQSLTFGGFALNNIIADFSAQTRGAFADPFLAANVGGGVWKRFSLTLDYGRSTIALTPNATYADSESYERAGLFLLNRGGKITVLDARPGTPAADAGIVKGDVIVSIDGTATSTMSLDAVRKLFQGPAGTVLKIHLAGAGGAERDVTLTLRDFV